MRNKRKWFLLGKGKFELLEALSTLFLFLISGMILRNFAPLFCRSGNMTQESSSALAATIRELLCCKVCHLLFRYLSGNGLTKITDHYFFVSVLLEFNWFLQFDSVCQLIAFLKKFIIFLSIYRKQEMRHLSLESIRKQ